MGEKNETSTCELKDVGEAADNDDGQKKKMLFFDSQFQSKYLATINQPLCPLAMIWHWEDACPLCVCMRAHQSVNTGAEKQSKERADPNPFPRMNMYRAKNPDPYLLTQIRNSAALIPSPMHAPRHACKNFQKSVLRSQKLISSTSENFSFTSQIQLLSRFCC